MNKVMNNGCPIRVAQIIGKMWAGGVEAVVFNYYRAIDHDRVQFDFYFDEDSTVEPPQDLIDMGARFIRLPPYQQVWRYVPELRRHLRDNKYTIVHSHLNTISVIPLYAAWRERVPVRIAHNHSVPSGREWKRDALKYFLRLFAKLFPTDYFACSEKAACWLFGERNYERGKVAIIKNAVDFMRFLPKRNSADALKEKLGLSGKFVVGNIGRFTFAKNHEFLLEVFRAVAETRKDAVLLLVGDGELNQIIHDCVKAKGLEERVVFAGKVPNPEVYYHVVDVMAVPSVFEGLSLTTIESQIAGVPVVVSEAIPEEAVISDGVVRLSLEVSNWAETILEMAGRKVTLTKNCEEYDIQLAAKKLENRYERMNARC